MKSKLSKTALLFLKANKILKRHYFFLCRDLTEQEIRDEAKNFLRKDEAGVLDNSCERVFYKLDKKEWETLAK